MISFNKIFYFSRIRVTFYLAGNEIVSNYSVAKSSFKYFFLLIEYVKYYISEIQKFKSFSFFYILILTYETWNISMEDIESSPY